jgi:hypothetical protein
MEYQLKIAEEVRVGDTYLFLDAEGRVSSSFMVVETRTGEFGTSLIGNGEAFYCGQRNDLVTVAA